MRPVRASAAVAVGLLVASGLAMVAAAPAAVSDIIPTTPVVDCGSGVAPPCVVSLTRNGGAPTGFTYSARTYTLEGSREVSLEITQDDGSELGADNHDLFSVSVDMGTIVPRVVTGKGREVEVTRTRAGSHRVTVTGRPVVVSGQCDQAGYPWRCPEAGVLVNDPADFNNREFPGVLDMQITDYGSWDDAGQRAALYGLDYFTNVAATSVPPDINLDAATDAYYLQVDLANRRFHQDGSLVEGRSELRIPNAFLRSAYGVPNPELMTGSSLTVSGGGTAATTSITQDAGDDAMVVLIDGMTFPDIHVPDHELRDGRAAASSMKSVRVKRGVVTPVKPRLTKAVRVGPRKARLTSTGARPRGARITGYQARCVAGRSTVVARGAGAKVVVTGLVAGRRYACRVRALSKAGPSGFSAARRV